MLSIANHDETTIQLPPNFGDGIDVAGDELTTPDESGDELLSTSEAAEILGVHYSRVMKLIKDKRLKAIQIGKVYVIRRADLKDVQHRPTGRPKK